MATPLDFTNFQNLGSLIVRDIRNVDSEEKLTLKGAQIVYADYDTDNFVRAGNEQVTNIAPIKNFVFALNDEKTKGNWFTTELFKKKFDEDVLRNKDDFYLPDEHNVFNEDGGLEEKHKSILQLALVEEEKEIPKLQTFLALDEGDMVQAGTMQLSDVTPYASFLCSSGFKNQNIGSMRNVLTLVPKTRLSGAKNKYDNLTPALVLGESPDDGGYGMLDFSGITAEKDKFCFLSGKDGRKGPIIFGDGCYRHVHAGTNIQGAHISTNANFFMNAGNDGPLKFENIFKHGADAPIIRKVHLAFNNGKWEWWSSESVDKPTDEGEPTTTKRPPRGGQPPITPNPSEPKKPKPEEGIKIIDKGKKNKPEPPKVKKENEPDNPIIPPTVKTGSGVRVGFDPSEPRPTWNPPTEPIPVNEDNPFKSPTTTTGNENENEFPTENPYPPLGDNPPEIEKERLKTEAEKAKEKEAEERLKRILNMPSPQKEKTKEAEESTAKGRSLEAGQTGEDRPSEIKKFLKEYKGTVIQHELGGVFAEAELAGDLKAMEYNGKFILWVNGHPILFDSEEEMMHYLNVHWLYERMMETTVTDGFNYGFEHPFLEITDTKEEQQKRITDVTSLEQIDFFNSHLVSEIPEILTERGYSGRAKEEVFLDLIGKNTDEEYNNPKKQETIDNDTSRKERKFGRQKQTASPSWEILSTYQHRGGYNPDYGGNTASDILRYLETDGEEKRELGNYQETVISTMFGIQSGSPVISKEYDEFMSSGTIFLAPADCTPWNLAGDLSTSLGFTLHQDRARLNFGLGENSEVVINAESGSSDYNLRINPSNSIILDIPTAAAGLAVNECYWDGDTLKRVT